MGNKYYFDSFANSSASDFYGSGTVVTTGQLEGDYAEVKVTADSNHQEFVGRTFWVESDAKTDGSEVYQLYTDGETATGVYVKIYATQPTRNVSLSIKDDEDAGVSGASVTIGETTKTTGSAGGCTFTLTDGDYDVTVTATGYVDKEDDITVAYDETSFNITIEESSP